MISPPDVSSRSEMKAWVIETVWPKRSVAHRFVIRRVKDTYYYATNIDGDLVWVSPISNPLLDHFHTAAIARRQFPWYIWIGNWIDCCLPKFLRKRIPYRLYEIQEVDIVYEEWQLSFPEFNDTVRSVMHTVHRV